MTDGQTERLKALFLKAFAELGNVTGAVRRLKVGRTTVYAWRKEDLEFARMMDEAGDEAVERLELEARRRAHDGHLKPIYQGGVKVGTVREYSDTLLIFLLKGLRPEKYRDKPPVTIDANAEGGVQIYLPQRKDA